MYTYCKRGSIHPTSLAPTLDGDEWLASSPGRFTPREKNSWYLLGRRLSPRDYLGAVWKIEASCPCRESNLGTQVLARCYSDCAIPAHELCVLVHIKLMLNFVLQILGIKLELNSAG
jgi:hypothetical protein